jgi:hypothetical protein
MTTVATNGRTIAWDGRIVTQWGLVLANDERKVRIEDGRVYGIAGGYAVFDALIRWYAEGRDPIKLPPSPESEPWVLLIRELDGRWLWLSQPMPYPHPAPLPYAIGAGGDMAIGAMEAGASPRDAVAIVCRRTVVSGGTIMVEDVPAAAG